MNQKIILCMIVKNESHIIEQTLLALIPYIDGWVVCDTGSTDDTPEIVKGTLRSRPGVLHTHTWTDFGTNRTEAFHAAQDFAVSNGWYNSYTFVVDADDVFSFPEGGIPNLTHDMYEMLVVQGAIEFAQPRLFRTSLDWRYEGVLHEYAAGPPNATRGLLRDCRMLAASRGQRSLDPEKYKKDAELLANAILTAPAHLTARYTFYCAQSYRDAGMTADALPWYVTRGNMPGWDEETFYARYQAAVMATMLEFSLKAVTDYCLNAFRFRPSRAEPLVDLAAYCRSKGQHALGFIYASAATAIPKPDDKLFVNNATYEWGALFELYMAAVFLQRLDVVRSVGKELLERNAPSQIKGIVLSDLAVLDDTSSSTEAQMSLPV